jgi:hypothetical protein
LIVPSAAQVPAFLGISRTLGSNDSANKTIGVWLGNLLTLLEDDPSSQLAKQQTLQICSIIVAELKKNAQKKSLYSSRRVETEVVSQALKGSVKLARKQIFLEILNYEDKKFPPTAYAALGEGIALFGFELLLGST